MLSEYQLKIIIDTINIPIGNVKTCFLMKTCNFT